MAPDTASGILDITQLFKSGEHMGRAKASYSLTFFGDHVGEGKASVDRLMVLHECNCGEKQNKTQKTKMEIF